MSSIHPVVYAVPMESVDAGVCLADRYSVLDDHPSFILAAVIRMLGECAKVGQGPRRSEARGTEKVLCKLINRLRDRGNFSERVVQSVL